MGILGRHRAIPRDRAVVNIRCPLLVFIVLGGAASTATAGLEAAVYKPDADVEAAVDSLFSPLVEGNLASGSILIARSGDVVLAKGYGFADREHSAPNRAETRFRLASASKAITAVAVLQLVEAGTLRLDSTLQSFIPGFPNGDRITVEQLLTHTSGIPSDVYLEGFGEKILEPLTLDQEIDWAREKAGPRFDPGARFEYSNTGYSLLSSIIEKVSGTPFEDYLETHILEPAGMTSSGLDSATRILPERARGYSRDDEGRVINTSYRNPSFGWGCCALYSTVLDLFAFDRALRDGHLLSEDSRRLMWKPRSETPWGDRYGMGWFIDDLDGHESVTALGATGGFMATLRDFRADDVVVVVLLNQDFMLYQELFDQVSLIALGKPWKRLLQEAQTSSNTRLSRFAGTYEMDDGALRKLRPSRGTLEFGNPKSGLFFRVYALSDSEGYVAEENARLRFRATEDGGNELLALYGNLAWRGHRTGDPGSRP